MSYQKNIKVIECHFNLQVVKRLSFQQYLYFKNCNFLFTAHNNFTTKGYATSNVLLEMDNRH